MTGGSSDGVLRQVHRLFSLGAVGTMSDDQLLDGFLSRRGEAAEAAFEELMNRHGPMVLRRLPRRLERPARRRGRRSRPSSSSWPIGRGASSDGARPWPVGSSALHNGYRYEPGTAPCIVEPSTGSPRNGRPKATS